MAKLNTNIQWWLFCGLWSSKTRLKEMPPRPRCTGFNLISTPVSVIVDCWQQLGPWPIIMLSYKHTCLKSKQCILFYIELYKYIIYNKQSLCIPLAEGYSSSSSFGQRLSSFALDDCWYSLQLFTRVDVVFTLTIYSYTRSYAMLINIIEKNI